MEDIHRQIAERCLLKYKQISKKKANSGSEWSPLAAVALVQNSCSGKRQARQELQEGSISNFTSQGANSLYHSDINIEVVSMGTGSKCIGPKRMDKDGKLCNNVTNP